MMLSNRTYDLLKWFALVCLPAFGVFYATIGVVWGLPYIEEVKTTCLALGTLIGALIGVSTHNYYQKEDEHDD